MPGTPFRKSFGGGYAGNLDVIKMNFCGASCRTVGRARQSAGGVSADELGQAGRLHNTASLDVPRQRKAGLHRGHADAVDTVNRPDITRLTMSGETLGKVMPKERS